MTILEPFVLVHAYIYCSPNVPWRQRRHSCFVVSPKNKENETEFPEPPEVYTAALWHHSARFPVVCFCLLFAFLHFVLFCVCFLSFSFLDAMTPVVLNEKEKILGL